MNRTALIQVLGGVAYGEQKAYEGARGRAEHAATEPERLAWRKQAAEELRHYKGFVKRLEALGADPDRAMRPYRRSLDTYHAREPTAGVEGAIWDYLGEGVADDLLRWLRKVADEETAAFIATVQDDEVQHEARAAAGLREQLQTARDHREATLATVRMAGHMLRSGRSDIAAFVAFVRLGEPTELIRSLVGGQLRRLRSIGLRPMGLPIS